LKLAQASNPRTDRFWCMFSMQLCIPTYRSGSSLAVRCLFAWQSYRRIYGAIIAGERVVSGEGSFSVLKEG
jgi:hypothetical protein